MDKSLKRLYLSLPYILFKGKYLIPQPPRHKRIFYGTLNSNPLAMIRKYFPHIINQTTIELSQADNKTKLGEIFMKEYRRTYEQTEAKIQEYTKEYMAPFKTIAKGIQPEILYYRENKKEIADIVAREGEHYSFKVVYRQFKKLDEAEKQRYREKAQQAIRQKMRVFSQSCAKYMVPQRFFQSPHILYLRDTVDEPIKSDMFKRYQLLSDKQKKIYREKSAQLRRKDKQNLQKFLEKRQLNIHQFQFIKEISLKFDASKEKILKDRKQGKKSLPIQQHLQEDDELSSQDKDWNDNQGK